MSSFFRGSCPSPSPSCSRCSSVCQCGSCGIYCSYAWFVATALFSSCLYIFDVGSDIALAIRHFSSGDFYWGSWTIVFIVMPWILFLIPIILMRKNIERLSLLIFFGIFNLVPVALLLEALRRLCCQRNWLKAQEYKRFSVWSRVLEVVLESLPQVLLQLYILAQNNNFDYFVMLTIISSIVSLALGSTRGVFTLSYGKRDGNEFLFLALFCPPVKSPLVKIVAFLPPLAFFASLKNHTSPGFLVLILYFIFYIFITA